MGTFCTSYHTDSRECGQETYFLTQIPQPIHRNSEMNAILSEGLTSMQSLPEARHHLTFLHSCAHRFGLHRLASTMATRVILSAMVDTDYGIVRGEVW
ncbi:hypothetical protein C8Q70DRAFT_914586 [Cubamyces menziesii]|nr:hypothetical protein C8Q70DRAFT_914586 [Cubamyces menziesii]